MAFRNYILCFALVAGTIYAGPINVQDGDTKCAITCEASLSDTGKFSYTPGTTYEYTYEGTTETKLHGTSEQTTSLKIQATADIEVISRCEFALKLRGVSLQENGRASPNSNDFKTKLEASALRFAFQDGKIENVCSETGEDERVLNIKRGVLATFQNSMDKLDKDGLFDETDVSGTCPTTYTSKTGVFGGVTIMKTKDILACTERTGNISSIHSERYTVPSKLQNAPLLSSTHECEQDIKSNILDKTTCSETLMFRPFSKENSGAVTKATQTLKYSTYRRSVSTSESAIQKRSSMLFHHVYDESVDVNAKSDVIALLQEICTETADGLHSSAPTLFGDLVAKMKRLDSGKFMQVYNAVNGGRICSSLRGKQFFYDAIPMVATEASMALTKKLIVDKIVQGTEAEMWLTQLAFIPRPTIPMLTAVKPLLNDATYRTKALLGVSAMVHKICDNTPNCGQEAEIADFINILNSNIGRDCSSTTPEQKELIQVTLKAIGNAGDAVTSSSVIGRCVTNNNLDSETRVIALQAYRRVPCSVSREDAMRLYQNAAHDSEVRIHAFLAVMGCPTSATLTKVRMMLSGEPVNQVGSFVWTYLENLKETASPLKQELSTILDDAKLREDFNLDVRKFSRNIEKSFFSDYLNAGAQIESNLIWSQKSYIPRSAMLNVTMEMFGNSINLVEFGGRVQGLEKIVEKFFGPNGYFSKKNTKELMDNKRQTANYISNFDNVFKTPDDKLSTSMYVKMFGNEIRFNTLDSSEWADLQSFNALDFLIKLAEPKKIDLTKNYQFIDSSLIVPTCVGLPMNLTVNGTASISMDVDGNIDLRNIAASPRNFDISGHIKPSAAVIVSGMMGVDAIVTKSTMKMVSTMHSSTQLDGKITLRNGEIFNIEMNTPQEKMEIFHVKTEFFMNGQEMTTPEPAKTYKRCSGPSVTKVIGMEMCVDISLPTFHGTGLPLPPFTGPMNAQVFIEKKDTHTGYSFTAKYENERTQKAGETYTKRTMHLSLDTPGSTVDRKLLLEGIYNPAEMAASASLLSPWKKFEWSAVLTNEVVSKKAEMSMSIDGTQTYTGEASLGISEKPMKTTWTPALIINVPNKPQMSITGNFVSGIGKVVAAANLNIKNFTRKPISLTSQLSKVKGNTGYNLDASFKSDALSSTVDGSVTIGSGSYNGRGSLVYQLQGRPEHRFSASGKFTDNSRGDLRKYALQAGFIPTEFPQYKFDIDTAIQATTNHVDATLDVTFNQDKFSLAHKTTKQGTLQALKLDCESSFKYPAKNIDVSTTVNHEHNSDLIKSSWSGTYNGQTVSTNVNLDKSVADKYVVEAGLTYPGRTLSFETDVTKMIDGEHKVTASAQWAEDTRSKVSAVATFKPGTTHELTTDIKIPGHPITISASVKPELYDFEGRADVTYKRDTYSLTSKYNIRANEITSSGSWVCPHRTMNYDMTARRQGGEYTLSNELVWDAANNKKVSFSATYNDRDGTNSFGRDASLRVTSPFGTQSFNGEFEMSNAVIRSELQYTHDDNQMCKFTGRYTPSGGEITVESPYIQYGPVKSIDGRWNYVDGHVDGSLRWAPNQEITGDAKWESSKYSLDVTTPFAYNRMGASVEIPTNGRQTATAYWNQQQATFSMSYPSLQAGDFTLTIPGHEASGKFSQSGDLTKFDGDAEFTYDQNTYSAKTSFNGQGPIVISAEVNTPLAVKKVSLDINHRGPIMDFTNKATLVWDNQRIRSTISFSPMESRVVVRTPWRDVSGNYKITGTRKNFAVDTTMKWADDKTIVADMAFNMNNGVMLSFSAETPFYSKVTGKFDHNGSWTNFRNEVELSWAPTKTVTSTTTLSTANGVALTTNYNAPDGMTGTATVSHTGSWESWNNRAELTMNNRAPMAVYSEFDKDAIKMKVGASNMPHDQYQSGEFVMTLANNPTRKTAVTSLTWNENQSINSRVVYSTENGYSLTASLKTPFTEDYSASATLTGTLTNFNNQMTVQWAPTKKIEVTAELSDRSGYNGKIEVDSPWRKMTWTANQRGNTQEFNVATTMSWEAGKEITTAFEFSRIGDIKAKWTMQTPFEQVRNVELELTHRGTTMQYWYTQLEGKFMDQTANVATTWDMRNGMELRFVTNNPWKNIDSTVKYTGSPLDFVSSAELTMDRKNYSSDLKFSFNDKLTIEANLKPVIYRPMSLNVQADGVTNTGSFTWGNNKSITATANSRYNRATNSLSGDASFTTPFEGYESGEATYSFSGTMESWRESVELTFKGQSAKLESSFTTFGQIKATMTLESPWYNADGSFTHTGNWENFECDARLTYAAGKTMTGTTKFDMRNGVTAEVALNAPFKRMDAKVSHMPTSSGFTANSKMNMDGKQIYKTDATFGWTSSNVDVEFSFSCPIKSFSGKYTHRGTMKTGCSATTEFTWDQTNKMSAEWDVSLANGFSTNFNIKSPWKNLSGEVTHRGTMTNFDNVLSLTCEQDGTVKLETEFTMSPDFMVKSTFTSPMKTAEAMVRHSGSLDNFQCTLEGKWDNTPVTGNLRWNMLSGYDLRFDATTPWKNFEGSFKTNTDLADLSSEANFKWGQQTFASTMTFNTRSGYAGAVTATTPWRTVTSNFDFTGRPMNFQTNAAFSWETGKTISTEVSFRKRLASAKVNTPWRNLEANYRSSGPLTNFNSNMDFSWEEGQKITLEARSDVRTGFDGEVKLTTPWRTMCVSGMYDMSFKTAGEISWETGKSITMEATYKDRVAMAKVNTPWRNLSANYQSTGPVENFDSTVDFSWEDGKAIKLETKSDVRTGFNGEIKLTTPWRTLSADGRFDMDTYSLTANGSWETGKSVGVELKNTVTGSRYESEFKFTSPWKTLTADGRFDIDTYSMVANGSWETGKSVGIQLTNTMREKHYETSVRFTSPWKNMNAGYVFDGEMKKFDTTQEIVFGEHTIKMESSLNILDAMSASSKLMTPWVDLGSKVDQTGDLTNFNGEYEVTWDDKKIASTFMMNRQNGFTTKMTVDSPWRQMETNFQYTGVLTRFTSSFDFSWETGKKMETTATFAMNPLKGTWTYKCPNHELKAEFEHTGTRTDFNNAAFFQWEPTKKIEASSSFKMADNIEASATVKTPFVSDFEASFVHRPTSGEMSLTTPYTEPLSAEYTYTDRYNFNSKVTYTSKSYTADLTTTWNNGVQTKLEATCPEHTYMLEATHTGDGFTDFVNTVEAKYDAITYKLTSRANMNTNTYSQTLETPITDWEKVEWTANWTVTDSQMSSKFSVARNNQKIEVETDGNVVWKKFRSIFSKTVTVKTPFDGWAENKVDASLEYSARKFNLQMDGYKGTVANKKSMQVYKLSTDNDSKNALVSYIKSDVYGEGMSTVNFNYELVGSRLTGELKTDFKFAPRFNSEMSLDTTYSRTDSGLNHEGTLEVTCSGGQTKVEWNAGSNQNMCETGLTYTKDGKSVVTYTHKTTWTTSYNKMDHEMTLKTPFEKLEDCDFKLSYDFTQAKKTVGLTLFNNPNHPFDFKSEVEIGDNWSMMGELTTPFTDYKLMKTVVTVDKAEQPWNVRMENTFNTHTITSEGRLSYTGPGQFDGSMTFTSQIPSFENLKFTMSNNKLNDQWKPHMTAEWASDKKIEMSGTFSWTNQYKASMDISTPFECCRSLVTDITVNNELPYKLTTSFDFKTNKMSDKLEAAMSFDMPSKTFSLTLNSPWETVRSFEVSAAASPRITAAIKLNDTTYFSVSGNGVFQSMYRHNLDVTVTYPFFNKYMRIQVNNDLSMPSATSQIDVEYMRGKEISSSLTFSSAQATSFSWTVTTPFEKFEKMSYSVNWSGRPTSWTENTTVEFYYGKVTTRTTFSLTNGFTYHQTLNGEMTNGWKNFNLQKDFVFTGGLNNFDLTAGMQGSFVPTMRLETGWKYATKTGSVKASIKDKSFEYTHTGPMSDFTCDWQLKDGDSALIGTWSFKNVNGLNINVDVKNTDESQRYKFNLDGTMQRGTITGMFKDGTTSLNARSTYSRASSPFRYTASTNYWVEKNGSRLSEEGFETSVDVSKDNFNYMWKYGGKQVFAVRAANPLNADDEYVPTITVEVNEDKYEFDGLYKNEGSGPVRDFKLHLNGPRGYKHSFDFKFDIRTQSAQLVPGDMKLFLTTTDSSSTEKLIDMTASWGNDHALITFIEPQPMRYEMDFSVSTTGQSGFIEANWDTSAANKKWKLTFNNKFTSSSRRLRSELDMDLVYMGVSRGFTSDMDWQTDSFSHKLTADYNGKQIGYDLMCSEQAGTSIEVITQWRSVKFTWNNKAITGGKELSYGLYWDSARDLNKKFLGVSRWEMTDTNTYKWTSTFSHPAFVRDITFTDTIAYDTDRVYFSFNKVVSFSTDSTKDVTFDMVVEKNGKWGVEFKQPFNNIDIRFGTEFTQSGMNGVVKYKGANGRMRTVSLMTSFDPTSMTGSVQLNTPIKDFKIETSATRTMYTISVTVDGQTYSSSFTMRPSDYYMLVQLTGSAAEMRFEAMKITGGYQMQLTKIEGQQSTIEGRAALSMNENRTINGDLRWNPALYSQIKDKVAALRAELKQTVKTMSIATQQEANKKMRRMSLGSDFDQIMPTHKTEMTLLQQDINAAKLTLKRAYDSDVMMMKTIDEASQKYYSQVMAEFETLRTQIVEYYERVIEPMVVRIGETAEQAMLDLTTQLNKIEQKLMALKTTAATKWNEQLDKVAAELEVVSEWLQTYIEKISNYLAAHPVMDSLKSIHSTTMNKFNSASDYAMTYASPVTSSQMYTDAIYNVHSTVNGAITRLGDRTNLSFDYILGLSDSLMYKIKFYYDYYDVPEHIKTFLTHSKNVAAEYLNDYLTHYIDQTLNDFKWVSYDLNGGHIEFEVTIPTKLDNINVMAIKTDLKARLDRFIAHMTKYHWNLREMFYMYKPRALGQILPPFDAQAIIAGQHIRTFDRRHYDFSSGTCSYLLARDFQDGNFTVFVNYDGSEQSLTVHSNGKVIDIAQDYSVKMDGSKVELPMQFFNTTVTRMGAKVVLTNLLGVEVVCDNLHGLCTVEMSGHYFAKTGGLFGTYNYEPLDDWTKSNNRNSSDVLAFANSWTHRCTGTNTAKSYTPVEGTKEYTACAALFKDSSSSLAPCFGIVKSDNAFHKCVNDMSNDVSLTTTNGPCKAAKFYENECRMAGIDVMEPAQCVACQVGTTEITMGETQTLSTPVMAADVVFVVEEKMCNYEIDTSLPNLAKMMSRSLGRNQVTDLRFGLVGFGGSGVHKPNHVHTMASKMFATTNELNLGTAELKFADDDSNKDVFSAIDFAAQYPFRAGARKVIVVLPCSDCSESALSYRAIAARLNAENINVHVITKFDFEITVSGKNPTTNYIFGMDDSSIYSVRDMRSLRGNRDLYSITSKPSDSCSVLALSTGGTVFNQKMMTQMRSSTIKAFQTVFSNRLAVTTTPYRCNTCSCEYNALFGMSRTVCNKC